MLYIPNPGPTPLGVSLPPPLLADLSPAPFYVTMRQVNPFTYQEVSS